MEFSCATPYGATADLFWSISGSGICFEHFNLPGGVERSTVSFMATAIHNSIVVVCNVGGTINGSSAFIPSPGALLLVQGMLI